MSDARSWYYGYEGEGEWWGLCRATSAEDAIEKLSIEEGDVSELRDSAHIEIFTDREYADYGFRQPCFHCGREFKGHECEIEEEDGTETTLTPVFCETTGALFCDQQCHNDYHARHKRIEQAKVEVEAKLRKKFPWITGVKLHPSGVGGCKAGCFNADRENLAGQISFPGAKHEYYNTHCAGCGGTWISAGDIDAWRKLEAESKV